MSAVSGLGRIMSGGAFLTGGALVQAGLGLVAQLVLMRQLIPEDFGRFAVVLAVCGLVQMVLSLRLNALIIRVPDQEMTPERRDRYRAALLWETVASTVVTLVWLAVSDLMSPFALMLVASLSLGQWSNQTVAFYERRMAYGRIVMVEAGSQILGHALAVGLVLSGVGAAALYLRELMVAVIRLAAFARIGALSTPLWRSLSMADWRLLIAEARAIWVDGVLESGLARMIVLGASALGGAHGTGIFAQSQRLATIPHQVLAPVVVRMSANLFSRIQDKTARLALLFRLTLFTLSGLAVAAVAAAILAEPLIPPLLGEHWRPASKVVVAMSGVIIFFSSFELLRAYCVTQHRMGVLLAARLSQYAVFLTALGIAARADDPMMALALGLSATYGVSFGVAAFGLSRQAAVPKGSAL
ncbi:MAG: oligosaccharide flippase family protein [Magnetospirillum sp.]|nr:oligosaccharide flippase family protein [Magnetospirillum sp.]